MHQRYWEHIRYHWLLLAWLLPGYKVTKVTWVTRVTRVTRVTKVTVLVQIFKIKSGFQGFRSYGGYGGLLLMIFLDIPRVTRLQRLRCFFQIFKRSNQGYKVSEVTRVTEGFCWWFSLTSLELQGYEGYSVFFLSNFQQQKCAKFAFMFYR